MSDNNNSRSAIPEPLKGLSSSLKKEYSAVSGRNAAVLVGLFVDEKSKDEEGVLKVLLTKRNAKLRAHGGEVCLPGGKADEEDGSLEATAIREAHEEVGLPRSAVLNVLGQLPPRLSVKLLSVSPIVAHIACPKIIVSAKSGKKRKVASSENDKDNQEEIKSNDDNNDDEQQHHQQHQQLIDKTDNNNNDLVLKANPDEVHSIFAAPLSMFYDPPKSANYSCWEYNVSNVATRVHEFLYDCPDNHTNYRIWGLTAHILVEVAARVYAGKPRSTVVELDPPNMPRFIDVRIDDGDTTAARQEGGGGGQKYGKDTKLIISIVDDPSYPAPKPSLKK